MLRALARGNFEPYFTPPAHRLMHRAGDCQRSMLVAPANTRWTIESRISSVNSIAGGQAASPLPSSIAVHLSKYGVFCKAISSTSPSASDSEATPPAPVCQRLLAVWRVIAWPGMSAMHPTVWYFTGRTAGMVACEPD